MPHAASHHEAIPPFPSTADQDRRELRRHKRETRLQKSAEMAAAMSKRAIGGVLLVATTLTGSTYAYIQRDINEGKHEVADSKPQTHLIYDTHRPDTAAVATYVATGLGTKNPSETAEVLTAHREVGNVVALEYSDKDINIGDLTDTVVTNARANGYKYLSFDGYSAGGSIMLAVAAEIYKHQDDIYVVSVTHNSSPVGEYGLTVKSQEASRIMSDILQFWPSLAYSEKARWAAEVLARHDRYYDSLTSSLDFDKLKHEIADVYISKIANDTVASGSLISSQFDFVVRHGVEKSLAELSVARDDKYAPSLFYTRSDNPDDDHVTDVEWSARSISSMATKYGLPLDTLSIDGIGHANPVERPDKYNKIGEYINTIRRSILRTYHNYGGRPAHGEDIYAHVPRKTRIHIGSAASAAYSPGALKSSTDSSS